MSKKMSYIEALEGIKAIYAESPKDKMIAICHELSTVLSLCLQKLRKLGVLEEFYDEIGFDVKGREHYEHLMKGVNLKK